VRTYPITYAGVSSIARLSSRKSRRHDEILDTIVRFGLGLNGARSITGLLMEITQFRRLVDRIC
jgi:hypothetical protein